MAWPRRPSLPWISVRLEAGRVGRDEERRDALGPGAAGAGEDQADVGPGAVGDEDLGAVDDASRRRRGPRGSSGCRGRSRCRARSGRSSRAWCRSAMPGSHSCFCSSVPWDRITLPTRPIDTDTMPRTERVGAAELLHADAVGDVVAAEAAVLLGDGEPEEAELAELGDDRRVDGLAAVPLGAVGHDLLVEEVARQLLEARCSSVSARSISACSFGSMLRSAVPVPLPASS